jgi:predicted Zn-dependent peptidase
MRMTPVALLLAVCGCAGAHAPQPNLAFRSTPPPPLERKPLSLPAVRSFGLRNGIPVSVLQIEGARRCAVRIGIRQPDYPIPVHLQELFRSMLAAGSAEQSGLRFSVRFDELQAQYDTQSSYDATTLRLSLPPESLSEGIRLLAQILSSPSTSETHFERRKAQLTHYYNNRSDGLQHLLVARSLDLSLFGAGHVYVSSFGGASEAKELDYAYLGKAFDTLLTPNNVFVAAAGNCAGDNLRAALEANLGTWKTKAKAPSVGAQTSSIESGPRSISFARVDELPSVHLRWSLAGPNISSDEWATALVVQQILHSRLEKRFRYTLGISDDVGTVWRTNLAGTRLLSYVQVAQDSVALGITALGSELDTMTRAPSEQELEQAKRRAVFRRIQDLADVEAIGDVLADAALYHVTDRMQTFEVDINMVTRANVVSFSSSYLTSSKGAVVVVGAEKSVLPALTKLGWSHQPDIIWDLRWPKR